MQRCKRYPKPRDQASRHIQQASRYFWTPYVPIYHLADIELGLLSVGNLGNLGIAGIAWSCYKATKLREATSISVTVLGQFPIGGAACWRRACHRILHWPASPLRNVRVQLTFFQLSPT